MNFIVVGTNHKYSPIELREKISFSKKRIRNALNFLKETSTLKGAIILSTCNRVEVYSAAKDAETGIKEIEDFISRYHEINKQKLYPYLYRYDGIEAARHLYSVTCGLDSLILGETQILGQVKSSLREAETSEFINEFLRDIFNQSIFFAKKVHRETKISEGKVSVGSVAIDFVKEKIGDLSGKRILIIGVGKVSELVLKYLKKENPKVVFISNRTFERAKFLASLVGARAVRFDRLRHFLNTANIVISATASPHFIIKKDTLQGLGNKLLIIDLALPRDVDPQVKDLKNVDLFSLENLNSAVEKNIEKRSREAEHVRGIINIEVKRLSLKHTKLEPEPALLP